MATNMAIMRIQSTIEAVLNHKSGIVSGVAAVYNRHAYFDEKREALELWAKKVQEMTTPSQSLTLTKTPKFERVEPHP